MDPSPNPPSRLHLLTAATLLSLLAIPSALGQNLEPIPEKLVVLTFDDSVRSHYEVVRPILKKYQFGATFFITEGFDFPTNKRDFMTWEQIAGLHQDGFEIGNHTRDHLSIRDDQIEELEQQLIGIRDRCLEHGIPAPTSFAWPGNAFTTQALPILQNHGIRFARRGGMPERPYEAGQGVPYEPGFDHPLLIPTTGDARPDWDLDDFRQAVEQARAGRIAILQFHGVPDRAHPWVHTSPEKFESFMRFLALEEYQVIPLRDLARFVSPDIVPQDPEGIIRDRQDQLAQGPLLNNARPPENDQQLRYWLDIMQAHHYSLAEMHAATGLDSDKLRQAMHRYGLEPSRRPPAQKTPSLSPPDRPADSADERSLLQVLPYPGGRHPRIGFRDGAIRPQRETKLSIFTPWPDEERDGQGYVVADFPEAIWWQSETGRELLYLAHTHVPTSWDRRGIELQPMEWQATERGWIMERTLPNQVTFGTQATVDSDHVRFEMWIKNGSPETLRGLLVQNCVMLAAAPGFQALSNDNKVIQHPFVACHDETQTRWIITAWEACARPWANPPCPCMHSDPQFPDCPPGESRRLRGWVSFHEGENIQAELERLAQLDWWRDASQLDRDAPDESANP